MTHITATINQSTNKFGESKFRATVRIDCVERRLTPVGDFTTAVQLAETFCERQNIRAMYAIHVGNVTGFKRGDMISQGVTNVTAERGW